MKNRIFWASWCHMEPPYGYYRKSTLVFWRWQLHYNLTTSLPSSILPQFYTVLQQIIKWLHLIVRQPQSLPFINKKVWILLVSLVYVYFCILLFLTRGCQILFFLLTHFINVWLIHIWGFIFFVPILYNILEVWALGSLLLLGWLPTNKATFKKKYTYQNLVMVMFRWGHFEMHSEVFISFSLAIEPDNNLLLWSGGQSSHKEHVTFLA